jgi:hypothetical protein
MFPEFGLAEWLRVTPDNPFTATPFFDFDALRQSFPRLGPLAGLVEPARYEFPESEPLLRERARDLLDRAAQRLRGTYLFGVLCFRLLARVRCCISAAYTFSQ